ncbi:hypothetical protein SOVF_081390 [Spinacia oleracea]|uniref:F-box/LRR-repeat protein 13-like n=1 Tax=Spinacia oleracea TaxID=3562 RepID=A0A9R0IJP5_SPIOL|nr:F-box/LRR-repeat protein 13-like [Spinacia oleracea]XP_021850603.2 F-box/LRR-repeat protein 13-like [Spinacia oleracea]XP_021850604.2 F-box/LRR-repeat protein 13-like [Spinacia oleracea]KNA17294.1 hypothetical protein SOVF_081390 [Spinacia oleracea]
MDNSRSESRYIKFNSTVNHILQQITSPHIQTFHLRIPQLERDFSAALESWIRQISARNVATIKVTDEFPDRVSYPTCMFEIQSLVELELIGFVYFNLPKAGYARLPNLKKLELIGTRIYSSFEGLWELIKSCPLLEVLSLSLDYQRTKSVHISAPNLKYLMILGIMPNLKLLIDAPMLEHIELDGYVGIYRFVKNPTRLLKADLSIWDFDGLNYGTGIPPLTDSLSQIMALLQRISNVKSLRLSTDLNFFKGLNFLDVDVGSIFRNLTHLILDERLNRSDLIIGVENPIPVCLLSKLKTIEILNIRGNAKHVKLLKYILSKVNVLERLYVSSYCDKYFDSYKDCDSDDEGDYEDHIRAFRVRLRDSRRGELWWEHKLSNTLLMIPKSSLTFEVKFVGNYICVSSDRSKNGLVRTLKDKNPCK